jgi:hypothetical protein
LLRSIQNSPLNPSPRLIDRKKGHSWHSIRE